MQTKEELLGKLPSILTWVFFGSEGITDNTDLMRCNMLCLCICTNDLPSVTEVLHSTGYKSCLYDIPDHMLTKEYISKIIDFRNKEIAEKCTNVIITEEENTLQRCNRCGFILSMGSCPNCGYTKLSVKPHKAKKKYYLVDAGYNPAYNTTWYDLIKASEWQEAEDIAATKGYGSVEDELSSNFRTSIGQLVFDMGYPLHAIKPIAIKG